MKKRNSKHTKQNAFQANMEIMTKKRIEAMRIFDSEKYIRLLQDPGTGFYVVFNGRYNSSHYAKNYQAAERYFNRLVAIS